MESSQMRLKELHIEIKIYFVCVATGKECAAVVDGGTTESPCLFSNTDWQTS